MSFKKAKKEVAERATKFKLPSAMKETPADYKEALSFITSS